MTISGMVRVEGLDEAGKSLGPPQHVEFGGEGSTLFNKGLVSLHPNHTGTLGTIVLYAGDSELLRFDVDAPVQFLQGVELQFRPKAISLQGMGMPDLLAWASATGSAPEATFSSFAKANPEASPHETWEAGYIAGSMITRILLTGEAE